MAKKKVVEEASGDQALFVTLAPKLRKLIIKNFACIGDIPVEIDLDDIVVIIGPNNTGKSTILRAYNLLFSSTEPKLTIDDFHERQINPEKLPEIELHTAVNANPPGHKWIATINGENIVRERWRWEDIGKKPIRQGFDVSSNGWSDNVPWGAPNVANSYRPKPHRIEAFAKPEDQITEVTKLLLTALKSKFKALQTEEDAADGTKVKSEYGKLLENLALLQKKIIKESETQIDDVETQLTQQISKVFKDYYVKFDAKPEDDLSEALSPFKAGATLQMGPKDGHLSTADKQGSGARRTLMWAALKYAAENKIAEADAKQNLLLLDEPELCLHPNAIREACNVLYDLPKTGNWQIMVTTHSPAFIDLSRDNTTIVRVERDAGGKQIDGNTVFRPERVRLSSDEKEELKMLNICDPAFAEFFFGGNIIVVEGDTEYTALKYIQAQDTERYRDIHIIRARGKANICLVTKILNQFRARYSVLHDSDLPEVMRKEKPIVNPAWTSNQKILDVLSQAQHQERIRLIALITNFELAFFGVVAEDEKPYNAWNKIKNDKQKFDLVKQLFDGLVDFTKALPDKAFQWNNIEELKKLVTVS